MGLSVLTTILQQFIDKTLENIPSRERYEIIMDNAMTFSTHKLHFEDLANLFTFLIEFGLKISPPHKCHFSETI